MDRKTGMKKFEPAVASQLLATLPDWKHDAQRDAITREFLFEHLSNRRFPAGQFIRQLNQLDYLEEPDVFHDVFGHVPMLMNP
jgi:phenylalanine-4-hydroxylase